MEKALQIHIAEWEHGINNVYITHNSAIIDLPVDNAKIEYALQIECSNNGLLYNFIEKLAEEEGLKVKANPRVISIEGIASLRQAKWISKEIDEWEKQQLVMRGGIN